MLGEGKSTGIFQFESSGIQDYLKQIKPESIEDLIALQTLYRPSLIKYLPQFIDLKLGRIHIKYPAPSLECVLKTTYGLIIYQEQLMQIAQIIGGFSLSKADTLRRVIGKNNVREIERLKIEFITGARKRNQSEQSALEIFRLIEQSPRPLFIKAHAAAYSLLSYQTAYLKANYPEEFISATDKVYSKDIVTDYRQRIEYEGFT